MKRYMPFLKIVSLLVITVLLVNCNDEFEGEIVKDNLPEVPVTFEGAASVGFNPYYTVSYSGGGNISIKLTIPEDSKLKIKEIRNVVAGATSINAASLTAAASIQYFAGPVAVDGKSFTLNTTIAEFNTKVPPAAAVNAAPAAGALLERAFMFRLQMDDNSFIIPVQCRVRITP